MVSGDCPDVGIGGLLSTGGTGYTTRKYGIAINNVINYEIVLASGGIVNASFTENRDLFDVLRGSGASSFGIVTCVTASLAPLEAKYALVEIKVQPSSMGEWLQYFFSIASSLDENVMFLYSYLMPDYIMIHGAIAGNSFLNKTKQAEIVDSIIDGAEKKSVTIIENKVIEVSYSDLYLHTYGADALIKATTPKSTWKRDFRADENDGHVGIMSGFVCSQDVPLGVFEQLEEHYYNPDTNHILQSYHLGTNVELFGGEQFPDDSYGIFMGKGCQGIVTTYPSKTDDQETNDEIKEFQQGFWDILRPYTNYSYRGYEDLSEGRSDNGGQVELMEFHYGEQKYQAMEVKTKYDPQNFFKNQISIPTLDCYEQNVCL